MCFQKNDVMDVPFTPQEVFALFHFMLAIYLLIRQILPFLL